MAFTRDWDESTPTDSTVANQIDEYNRYLRVDMSDRLKDMIYGLIAGENSLSQHFQYIQFYEQASVSQPSAGYGRLYCKAVGGKCELHWQDEDGDEIPLTNGGNIGGGHIELLAGMDLLGSATSDITINTNKFTVAGATGNTVVAGTLNVTGVATLGDGSVLAAATQTADGDRTIVDLAYAKTGDTVQHDTEGGYSNCDVDGTMTKVYTKYFTGTLDADSSTSVAHGITGVTNILHVSAAAINDGDSKYKVSDHARAASASDSLDIAYDGTNVYLQNVGTSIQGNAYVIKIDYKL